MKRWFILIGFLIFFASLPFQDHWIFYLSTAVSILAVHYGARD